MTWLLLLVVFQGSVVTTTLLGPFQTETECVAVKEKAIRDRTRDYPGTPFAAEPVCVKYDH